jgi:hypothetical protein
LRLPDLGTDASPAPPGAARQPHGEGVLVGSSTRGAKRPPTRRFELGVVAELTANELRDRASATQIENSIAVVGDPTRTCSKSR